MLFLTLVQCASMLILCLSFVALETTQLFHCFPNKYIVSNPLSRYDCNQAVSTDDKINRRFILNQWLICTSLIVSWQRYIYYFNTDLRLNILTDKGYKHETTAVQNNGDNRSAINRGYAFQTFFSPGRLSLTYILPLFCTCLCVSASCLSAFLETC